MISKFKKFGRLIHALNGFFYDFLRFVFYSGWSGKMDDKDTRNYHVVKIYHALEKSMSYKNRNPDSGWSTALLLLEVLKKAKKTGNIGFHDKAGVVVLKKFINMPENVDHGKHQEINSQIKDFEFSVGETHGVMPYSLDDFYKGKLKSPESFFMSRYSLREFSNGVVSSEILNRAILLAEKTPSVCNRQPWHVYHSSDQKVKDMSLKMQSGNRGFGDRIPNLLIITSDLKGFMAGNEHYQQWIDGGLFSMSLIYALHSLGVASCCLNWSQSPSNDKLLRKKLNIKSNHTVIMMLAVGWPDEENKVCVSARRPIDEISSQLKLN